MLALGEVAEALLRIGGRIRRWPAISRRMLGGNLDA
jgi:hypothetical protein